MLYLLHQMLDRSAGRFPDQEAFRFGDRAFTYAELARKMHQLARLLSEVGVKKGDRIGIYLPRSLETSLAIYGILNCGAVYVPLDPNAPIARTRLLIQDCGIRHLIADNRVVKSLKQLLTDFNLVESIVGVSHPLPVKTIPWETLDAMPYHLKPAPRVLEQDLAYILYTSGTTGVPKGVMHSHYSGLSYAKLTANLYNINSADKLGNHSPIHFDISTLGYFTGPFAGATTVIIPDAHTKLIGSLVSLLEKEELTIWYSVPLALIQMMQSGLLKSEKLEALRWILFAGEPFPTKHLRKLMGMLPRANFSNIYGPTETNQCTYYHLKTPPASDDPIPIGRIWDNTESLVVDENDMEVPAGETGELLIRSATMMKGYWARPDLSKNAFLQIVDQAGVEKKYYRTGDLVKLSSEGELLFFGRKDRQVKVRGYRIELDEIGTVLMKHPLVIETAVYTLKLEGEVILLKASILVEDLSTLTADTLKEHCKQYLPIYAIPQAFHITDSLPRTSTGKINYQVLKEQALKN